MITIFHFVLLEEMWIDLLFQKVDVCYLTPRCTVIIKFPVML